MTTKSYWATKPKDMSSQEFATMRQGMWLGDNIDSRTDDELRAFIAGDVAAILRNDGTPLSPPVPGGVGLVDIRAAIGALQFVADELEYRQAKAVVDRHEAARRMDVDFGEDAEIEATVDQCPDEDEIAARDPHDEGRGEVLAALKSVVFAYGNDTEAGQNASLGILKKHTPNGQAKLSALPPDKFAAVIRACKRAVKKEFV